jgi:anti-sigma-K factor RskA
VAAVNLPPPPDGRTYQLWGIRGTEAPVSLGIFETTPAGTALVTLSPSDQEDFDVSAITEEPAGGSPQPTTTPFLAGPWTAAE